MNKVNNCVVENCIPTPSSCVGWNGGSIEFLGICDGDSLNTLVWEIVAKLEAIAGDDLSQFDIDSLLDICNQKAPTEVTIISILNLLKANQVCLKDFIDGLNDKLNDLFKSTNVNVNLKCYAEFDSIGNSLSLTRDQLDQLIINNLCDQKLRLDGVEGSVINLQSQIDNINNNQTVDELNFATCVDAGVKPTSQQVIAVAAELCDLEGATGNSSDIAAAIANVPSTDNARYGLLPGWILTSDNQAEVISNLLLKVANLESRLIFIETNCCAATCADVKLGFSAIFNEDQDGVILRFTFGAGTDIPLGFTDKGSTGTITDVDGNIVSFNIAIANNLEEEIIISGLNTTAPLDIDITALIGTDALTCEKCLHRSVTSSGCSFCTITATGEEGSSAVIVYTSSGPVAVPIGNTTSTTTSTTTVGI